MAFKVFVGSCLYVVVSWNISVQLCANCVLRQPENPSYFSGRCQQLHVIRNLSCTTLTALVGCGGNHNHHLSHDGASDKLVCIVTPRPLALSVVAYMAALRGHCSYDETLEQSFLKHSQFESELAPQARSPHDGPFLRCQMSAGGRLPCVCRRLVCGRCVVR